MKANSSFPHPVLGVNKSVLPDLDDQAVDLISCTETENDYVYTFQLKQENKQITQYIREGHAEYICEVDCSKTMYKKTTTSSSATIEVKMNKLDVTGHVDFSFYIVTKLGMPKYINSQFNPDYKDSETGTFPSFSLEKGAVLALFPTCTDNINFRFNNKPELKSFIQVANCKDNDEDIYIDIEEQIISVYLPEKLFNAFQNFNNKDNRGIFYSSLIMNALVKGILNINESGYENKLWADGIRAIFECNPDKYKGLSLDEPRDAVDIAFKMLSTDKYKTPYDLLFSCLMSIQD